MKFSSIKIKKSSNSVKILKNEFLAFSIGMCLCFFLSACASMQQPTGGPKDTTPPNVIAEEPKNLTTNFNQTEIAITFDEYVKLQNEFAEISFSPDMDERPLLKIKKKTLLIQLPDSLDENTTYTINFGKALVDYNEGNELKNYSYVFSTGPVIDSLSVSGNVRNAFTLEPELDATVLLIPVKKDSIFRKSKANIFTHTDSSGNFSLKNLREDTYRIYALKETNNDRIYNNPEELIGFLKDSIYLDSDTSGIQLDIFKEIPKTFRTLQKTMDQSGKINLAFNRPVINPSVILIDNPTADRTKIVQFNTLKDTAAIWVEDLTFDSLSFQLNERQQPLDTIVIKRNKTDEYKRLITVRDNIPSKMVNRIQNVQLTTSVPTQTYDKTQIYLYEDSVSKNNYSIQIDTTYNRHITIAYPWKSGRQYTLTLEENALKGFFGEQFEAYKRDFTYDDSENFGDFTLNIKTPDSAQYMIQLLKVDDGETVDSKAIIGSQYISYKNLPGIKFGVRIVYDANKNDKWDTGDVDAKRYPENIWYFDKIITIRPNWEQEEILTIPLESTLTKQIPTEKIEPIETPQTEELPNIKEGIIERPISD